MLNKIKAKYPCSQAELIAVCYAGWRSCLLFIVLFFNKKKNYTNPYITAKVAAITAAEKLPGISARYAKSRRKKLLLQRAVKQCLEGFNWVEQFIRTAYEGDEEEINIQLEALGKPIYPKASGFNWDEAKALNEQVTNYLEDAENATKLTDDGGMPTTFIGSFAGDVNAFTAAYNDFLDEEEASVKATNVKVTALNQLYDDLLLMFGDGVLVLKDDEANQQRFIFAQVLSLVSGAGTAGIRGIISDKETGVALVGVDIHNNTGKYRTITDDEGYFEITGMAAGDYVFRVTFATYKTIDITLTVKVGTVSSFDFEMEKV